MCFENFNELVENKKAEQAGLEVPHSRFKLSQTPSLSQQSIIWVARFLKVCRYDQLCRNSCYDELGCNSLVVIALLLRPA